LKEFNRDKEKHHLKARSYTTLKSMSIVSEEWKNKANLSNKQNNLK